MSLTTNRMSRRYYRLMTAWILGLLTASVGHAAEPNPEGEKFFEERIRPVLIEHCADCHTGTDGESDFQVDSLAGIVRGGTRGPGLVPGKPAQSLLISVLRHGEELKMPPKQKLPASTIADFVRWVEMGAPWPNAEPVPVGPRPSADVEPTFTEEQRTFWAFVAPKRGELPTVQNSEWIRSPIDAYVLAKLEAAKLAPAPQAEKRTLIRRATFDLLGLPPTPAEVDAFLADEEPGAFARLVDRLLESPRYGERWGRHWLDVARYADSNGLDENLAYANAYHYRDYVVSAFNSDKPYDRFITEQLAGDLLPDDDSTPRPERLAATGILSLGAKMLAEDDPVKMQMDIIDEQLDTLGRAFLGMTLGCARCHDHKFDPISAADYYALAGIFKSTKTMENFNVVARWQELPLATSSELAVQEAQLAQINEKQAELDKVTQRADQRIANVARTHVDDYLLAAHRRERLQAALKDLKPVGDDATARTQLSVALLEAEDFQRGNVANFTTGYGEGIGVLVNRGEAPNFVEYDVNLPSAGLYQLELRYAAAASRPCALSINGSVVKSDAAGKVTGSWNPDTQTWFVEGLFELSAGANVVRLEHPQFFPHIDKLLLAPAPDDLNALVTLPQSTLQAGLVSEWIDQWAVAVAKAAELPESPLHVWATFLNHGPTALGKLRDSSPVATELLADPLPTTVQELAQRYGNLGRRVVNRVEAKTQSDGAPPAELDDSVDETFRKLLFHDDGPLAVPKSLENHYTAEERDQVVQLRADKLALESDLPTFPVAMAVSDQKPEDVRIHARGSHLTQTTLVPRRFPRVFPNAQPEIPADHSGRLEFAQWLTDPAHPLTARVMVNRVWLWHFGKALVRSPDNFGRLGERPTHPALLDWLALEFVESGWSLKDLHRLIMLSSTYQMSTAVAPQAMEADPENRLLWRMNRRRLEAEAVRDALLACGGEIEFTMGGSLLPTENRKYVTSTANVNPVVYVSNRRSIYLPVVRSALYDVFQAFDFADPSVINGDRQSTIVAPQALFMMNSEFVSQQSALMAKRLESAHPDDPAARVNLAYRLAYGRPVTQTETQRALDYVARYTSRLRATPEQSETAEQQAWQSLCRAILAANEFLYVE